MLRIYDFGTFTIYCVCITLMSRLTISSSTLIKFCIWFLVWLLKFTHEYRKLRIIGWGATNHELQFIDHLSLRWNLFWCNKMTLSLFWTNVSVQSTSLIVQSLPAWFLLERWLFWNRKDYSLHHNPVSRCCWTRRTSCCCVLLVLLLFGASFSHSPYPGADVAVAARREGPIIDPSSETVRAHDTEWIRDQEARLCTMNDAVVQRQWSIRSSVGDVFGPGCDVGGKQWSPIDYFFMMFPMTHTQAIVQLTNEGLSDNNKVPTTAGMILKFFGMIILCTKFEFKSWSSLWSTTAASNMFQLHPLGQQVWVECALMIFGGIFAGASSLLSVRQKWAQKNFVGGWWTILLKASMADHRASTFQPSDVICVDESISRWYGKGDHWINFSLPMYVAMERKPDNWCEIQNSAGGRSGIMMRLKLVKTADENRAAAEEQGETERVPHSAAIIKKLVLPWIHTDRIVCADSSFASVPTVKLLNLHGMQFVGVEKTATRNYPMRFLSPVVLNHRGDWKGLVSNGLQTGDPTMLTFVLMDCWQTRYFIASASSLEAGTPYKRWRWQQVDTIPNADPTNVELLVPQPKAAELFFSA